MPLNLGNYTVTSATDATNIFDAMKCSDLVNCFAGHLLAAELDVAGGSSICISGVIYRANHLLKVVGYNGVGSYTITSTQAATALNLQTELDNYTNDSSSTGC